LDKRIYYNEDLVSDNQSNDCGHARYPSPVFDHKVLALSRSRINFQRPARLKQPSLLGIVRQSWYIGEGIDFAAAKFAGVCVRYDIISHAVHAGRVGDLEDAVSGTASAGA